MTHNIYVLNLKHNIVQSLQPTKQIFPITDKLVLYQGVCLSLRDKRKLIVNSAMDIRWVGAILVLLRHFDGGNATSKNRKTVTKETNIIDIWKSSKETSKNEYPTSTTWYDTVKTCQIKEVCPEDSENCGEDKGSPPGKKNVFFWALPKFFDPFFHNVFPYILTSISCYLILFGHF